MSCVHRLLGACTCLALAGGGCADEPAGGGGASADAGREAGPGPGGDGGSPADGGGVEPPPDELTHFYDQLQEDALAYPPVDGDWPDDYGDAPFYGLAFYSRAGETQDDDRYREIARAA